MLIRQLVCVQKGMGEVRMAMEGEGTISHK